MPDEELPPHPDDALQPLPGTETISAVPKPRGIAPIWHTVVLVLAILGYSVWGAIGAKSGTATPLQPPSAAHSTDTGTDHVRLIRYALTGSLELIIVAWIGFGLFLRKVPFRSLFGAWPRGLNDITKETLIAASFWLCSMVVLAVCGFSWLVVQDHIYKQETAKQSTASSPSGSSAAKPKSPEEQQFELIRQLTQLAPANGIEIAAWGFLCLIVGFSEEIIFRGYLQSQGIALLRSVPIGLLLTAMVFGAGHGYQGARGVFLISIYGALFGILVQLRRNLLPGMIAHAWQDFFTGMMLAFLRANPQLFEHMQTTPK